MYPNRYFANIFISLHELKRLATAAGVSMCTWSSKGSYQKYPDNWRSLAFGRILHRRVEDRTWNSANFPRTCRKSRARYALDYRLDNAELRCREDYATAAR